MLQSDDLPNSIDTSGTNVFSIKIYQVLQSDKIYARYVLDMPLSYVPRSGDYLRLEAMGSHRVSYISHDPYENVFFVYMEDFLAIDSIVHEAISALEEAGWEKG